MEIEQIVDLKLRLEAEIKHFILEKFEAFAVATKLYPSSISIDTIEQEEMGRKPEMIITDVSIKIEI